VIDVIATDHAPHAVHEKEVDFVEAPCGVLGLETAFGVVMDMVRTGELSPMQLVSALSEKPAKILNVPGGRLSEGDLADVVVLDPERSWTYDTSKGYSKSRNSPWDGEALTGRVIATFVDGAMVYHADRGVLMS
jgi:dihydroorotase